MRRCHGCLLNLGSRCWAFVSPREQWKRHAICPGYANEEIYGFFRYWQKQSDVKSRRQIRQEAFRRRPPEPVFHLEGEEGRLALREYGRMTHYRSSLSMA